VPTLPQHKISSINPYQFFSSKGIGSDFLVKKLSATRVWCLVVAGLIFTIAQLSGINVSNPNYLFFVSGLSGLAYGLLFGVFPSIVAETFGIRGLSQNWGFMTVAPVISSNVFNLLYGTIFDHHSVVEPGGERVCHDGLECYRAAYGVTLVSCVVGVGVTLWVIRHQQLMRLREAKKAAEQD
jgi:MFS family permease